MVGLDHLACRARLRGWGLFSLETWWLRGETETLQHLQGGYQEHRARLFRGAWWESKRPNTENWKKSCSDCIYDRKKHLHHEGSLSMGQVFTETLCRVCPCRFSRPNWIKSWTSWSGLTAWAGGWIREATWGLSAWTILWSWAQHAGCCHSSDTGRLCRYCSLQSFFLKILGLSSNQTCSLCQYSVLQQ